MRLLTELQFCPTSSTKSRSPIGGLLFVPFLLLYLNQRQSFATVSSNVVGTDGENAFLLAKFGR